MRIRTALWIEFNNPKITAAELHKACKETASVVKDLWEPYAEKAFAREISNSKSEWTHDYWGMQLVYLKTNFSEKRFDHLIEVRQYLMDKNEWSV